MPIGNLTSQFFANVYLNELDKFVKHRLRAKFYIRYLDDFVILHRNKSILEDWQLKIDEFLRHELKLELHSDKSKIYPLCDGINFLGFRVFYYHKLLKKSNLRQIRSRMMKINEDYKNSKISKEDINRKMDGWFAYAMHGNTHNLCRKLRREHKNSFYN
jgi:hypothetical protein